MRRRQFLTLLGAAIAAWPLKASARGGSMPTVGFLNSGSPRAFSHLTAEFNKGLQGAGFVHRRNMRLHPRWAQGELRNLPRHAADLVRMGVDVIAVSGGNVAAQAAIEATRDIPIVFLAGLDARSILQNNVTGITTNTPNLLFDRITKFRDLVPDKTIALLVNPRSQYTAAIEQLNLLISPVPILRASTMPEVKAAFAEAAARDYALLASADPFFTENRGAIVRLEHHYRVKTGYSWVEFVRAGGLTSFGPDLRTGYRSLGRKVAALLRSRGFVDSGPFPFVGAGPRGVGTVPVEQLQDVREVINRTAARAHGVRIPHSVRSRAELMSVQVV